MLSTRGCENFADGSFATLLLGLRIVALVLSTTGISLLAYMEASHSVLVSVVLAASSAAGTAVYKVMFKKVMGEVNFLEVSIFFSVNKFSILAVDCCLMKPFVPKFIVTFYLSIASHLYR